MDFNKKRQKERKKVIECVKIDKKYTLNICLNIHLNEKIIKIKTL